MWTDSMTSPATSRHLHTPRHLIGCSSPLAVILESRDVVTEVVERVCGSVQLTLVVAEDGTVEAQLLPHSAVVAVAEAANTMSE